MDPTFALAVGLLISSFLGFVALLLWLAMSGRPASATTPLRTRRPIPYPGCPACQVAAADDDRLDPTSFATGALERHQLVGHSGRVRWW